MLHLANVKTLKDSGDRMKLALSQANSEAEFLLAA
jgi:hypothetical protein